jgi:FixJ family two-component response regulator
VVCEIGARPCPWGGGCVNLASSRPVRPGCDAADGIDLQRGLSESGSPLPIIFMTTVDDEATRRQVDVGCIASLRKPFPATLIGAIDKATG